MQILTQLVVVQDEKGDREAFPVEEIQIIDRDRAGDSAYSDDDDAVGEKPADLQDDYSTAKESDPVDEASPLVSQEDNKDIAVGPLENQKNNRRNRNRRRQSRNRNRNTAGNAGGNAAPQERTDANPNSGSTNRQPDQGRTNDTL